MEIRLPKTQKRNQRSLMKESKTLIENKISFIIESKTLIEIQKTFSRLQESMKGNHLG